MEEEPQSSAELDDRSLCGLSLKTGTIVGGSYIIFECLGIRGDSAVYKCRHKDLAGPFLAMKLLHPSLASDSVAAARFHQEVVASYNVTHPNVVRTHEFISEGTTIAYTMEYMEYGTLKERLEQPAPLHIEDIVTIGKQICGGLDAIHNAGIIHRNIKPGNIFFSSDGNVKIADFGIARTSSGPRLTGHGEVLGTVGYASPEYLETGEVDQRSDIYALGMILYESITRQYPFSKDNPLESIKMRLTSDPPSPGEIRSDCPPELSKIVLRALSRKPDDRYQTADEVLEELEDLGIAMPVPPPMNAIQEQEEEEQPKSIIDEILSDEVSDPYVEKGFDLDEFQEPLDDELASQIKRRLAIGAMISGVLVALGFTYITALDPKGSEPAVQETTEKKAAANERVDATQKKVVQTPSEVSTRTTAASPASPAPTETVSSPTAKSTSLSDVKAFFGISQESTAAAAATGETRTHVVVAGDTVSDLAIKYSVPQEEIIKLNQISNPNLLSVGSTLRIPQ